MSATAQPDRRILITSADGRLVVAVDPAEPGDCAPEAFDDHRRAYGFACGLRLSTRLKISDLSGVN